MAKRTSNALIAGLTIGITLIVLFVVVMKPSVTKPTAMENNSTLQLSDKLNATISRTTQPAEHIISKEDALTAIGNKFFNSSVPFNLHSSTIRFEYLEYNGTANGNAAFLVHPADPTTRTINASSYRIIFDYNHGFAYINSTDDRFVWVVVSECFPTCTSIFVDAEKAIVIGSWNPCPFCVWSPYITKR